MDFQRYFAEYDKSRHLDIESFSREDIKVEYRHHTISWYLDLIESGEIYLDTDFQRDGGVWKPQQKSRFIESLLMHLPITPIFLAQDYNYCYDIVDGLQRLTTLREFIQKDGFSLQGLEFYKDIEGCRYKELPRVLQRFISTAVLPVSVLNPGVSHTLKVNIFHRINTSGATLTNHEVRVSLYGRTYFYKMLDKVSEKYIYDLLGREDIRKKYQEQIFKSLALSTFGIQSYQEGQSMSDFLDKSIDVFSSLDDFDIDKVFINLELAVSKLLDLVNSYPIFDNSLGRMSNALFVSFLYLSMTESDFFFNKKKYELLLSDPEFKKLLSNGTSKYSNIIKRNEMIREVVC
ncbi:DUF262 domain-containing protein [Vibrio splendidus]